MFLQWSITEILGCVPAGVAVSLKLQSSFYLQSSLKSISNMLLYSTKIDLLPPLLSMMSLPTAALLVAL